jgi:hypothetical protein
MDTLDYEISSESSTAMNESVSLSKIADLHMQIGDAINLLCSQEFLLKCTTAQLMNIRDNVNMELNLRKTFFKEKENG